MSHDQHRWMRPPEAASYLDMREQTLARWRMLGEGPSYAKVGRSVSYSQQQLDEWLARQTVESAK